MNTMNVETQANQHAWAQQFTDEIQNHLSDLSVEEIMASLNEVRELSFLFSMDLNNRNYIQNIWLIDAVKEKNPSFFSWLNDSSGWGDKQGVMNELAFLIARLLEEKKLGIFFVKVNVLQYEEVDLQMTNVLRVTLNSDPFQELDR